MTFRLLAFHYPRREHDDEMVRRVARVAEVMAEAPGFVDVDCCRDEASGAVVSTARFKSRQACMDALSSAAGVVDMAYDDREYRPRDIYYLTELT